ncbi:MAG: transporter, partial [Pseudomonadota bacterium]
EGNRIGTDSVSPETIATTVPNRFFGRPMQPPTLRVVPTEMSMNMHMVGAMYAPTDWLTLMAMGSYVTKDMDHITFMGPAGTTRLGTFTTNSSGFGDTKLGGLVRLYEDETHHLHANIGFSLPTGSITETDRVLAPTGMRPTLRLPYAMQLGSGTFDLLPGLT